MNSTDVDELSNIQITPEFFHRLFTFREFKNILNDLDISDEDQLDLFETLDVDGGGTIDLEELIVGISKLRGDARRSDIISVNLIARNIQGVLSTLIDISHDIKEETSSLMTRQDHASSRNGTKNTHATHTV